MRGDAHAATKRGRTPIGQLRAGAMLQKREGDLGKHEETEEWLEETEEWLEGTEEWHEGTEEWHEGTEERREDWQNDNEDKATNAKDVFL